MKKIIKVTIERTKDMYSAYADTVEGVYGSGDTVDEAKACIEASAQNNIRNPPAGSPNTISFHTNH